MAEENLRSHREMALFATVNLMQDSVEAFLLAASEFVNAGIDPRTDFDKYFAKIDEKISPKQLPFRLRLIALNKIRINSKHYGIKPDRTEVQSFVTACREFFRESCQLIFDCDFWSISLLELLEDGEIKQLLKSAQNEFENGNFLECLIECRKVMFIEFEQSYDVSKFKDGPQLGILGAMSKAPYYARDKEWIEKNVNDPFNFIVLDHREIERELMTNGIDTEVFWNIWRLTPAVYRYPTDKEWVWHNELAKTESGANEENAAYVLEQSIDIALRMHERRQKLRYRGQGNFFVYLKHDGVNIYRKADRNSDVNAVTENGLRKISVEASTVGLDGTGKYWKVSHHIPGKTFLTSTFYYGYVHDDEIDWTYLDSESAGD